MIVTYDEIELLPKGKHILKFINRLKIVDFLGKISKKTTK